MLFIKSLTHRYTLVDLYAIAFISLTENVKNIEILWYFSFAFRCPAVLFRSVEDKLDVTYDPVQIADVAIFSQLKVSTLHTDVPVLVHVGTGNEL